VDDDEIKTRVGAATWCKEEQEQNKNRDKNKNKNKNNDNGVQCYVFSCHWRCLCRGLGARGPCSAVLGVGAGGIVSFRRGNLGYHPRKFCIVYFCSYMHKRCVRNLVPNVDEWLWWVRKEYKRCLLSKGTQKRWKTMTTCPGRGAKYCNERVRMTVYTYVCPLACLKNHTYKLHRYFVRYLWLWLGSPLTTAQCWLPVLWMTSRFRTMGFVGQNERRRYDSSRSPGGCTEAKLYVFDCLVWLAYHKQQRRPAPGESNYCRIYTSEKGHVTFYVLDNKLTFVINFTTWCPVVVQLARCREALVVN